MAKPSGGSGRGGGALAAGSKQWRAARDRLDVLYNSMYNPFQRKGGDHWLRELREADRLVNRLGGTLYGPWRGIASAISRDAQKYRRRGKI